MRDYWWHITIAIFAPLGHFLNAAQFNTKSNLTEDGFLQRVSIRKFGFMFLFLDKKTALSDGVHIGSIGKHSLVSFYMF